MWEVTRSSTQCKDLTTATEKNLLAQATKPELSSYYHTMIFSPNNTSLLNSIKKKI